MSAMKRALVLTLFCLLLPAWAAAQKQKPDDQSKPPVLSPSARLAAARTMYVKSAGGSRIPYNVISTVLEDWGRYTVVDEAARADLIVEITSPDAGGGVSVSSTTTRDSVAGRPVESTSASRELSNGPIRMIVRDARSKLPLWSGSEQPKGAMREKAREDNMVEAALRLVRKFRERVEPNQ
jgi:hypothetical protein